MPRVTMKLSAKERKAGLDLRNYSVLSVTPPKVKKKVKKPAPKPKKAKTKVLPTDLIVSCNDIDDIVDELDEWDSSASLDVTKVFRPDQRDEAVKSADASASGSNVDFVVYEVREIYRAKRGL